MYSTKDLSEKLGIKRGTLRRWVHEGMPVTRDLGGRVWLKESAT